MCNGNLSDGQNPEIWTCEKIHSAAKLLEATACKGLPESADSMNSRTIANQLLEKVKCIANLLDAADQSASVSDFNSLVFGPTTPPVPPKKELVHWYELARPWLIQFYIMLAYLDFKVGGIRSFGLYRFGCMDKYSYHSFGKRFNIE
jgi:hypothetical protein